MADTGAAAGRLIAVDGSRGKDVNGAADALAARLQAAGVDCVVSRWDASGLFGELLLADTPGPVVSARTLSLVFAADLAFRIRWEIRPALEAGRVVIAAPYVATAVAFGSVCGLEAAWLREVVRFAPAPDRRGHAVEKKADRAWKPRRDRGYAEFCAAALAGVLPGLTTPPIRKAMVAALAADGGRAAVRLSDAGVAKLAAALSRSRSGGPRRSATPPRTARRRPGSR